jgi:hypothetical protein
MGLEAFLSLTHSLTLQGPGTWWDRKVKEHPLMLVNSLITVAEVGAWPGLHCELLSCEGAVIGLGAMAADIIHATVRFLHGKMLTEAVCQGQPQTEVTFLALLDSDDL